MWSAGIAKSPRTQVLFICENYFSSSLRDFVIHLYLKIPGNFILFIFWERFWLYIHHLSLWSNLPLTFPTHSYLLLYFFCASLLYLFIMWLSVSSLSPHSLQLLSCVLSIFTLILLDLNIWLSATISFGSRVFANGPEDLGSIPGHVVPKTLKMVLDTSLLNTQQY